VTDRVPTLPGMLVLAVFVLPSTASAASGLDRNSTHAYLIADYRFARANTAGVAKSMAAINALVRDVRTRCPQAAAGAPATVTKAGTEFGAEVLGAVLVAAGQPERKAAARFVRAVVGLRWRDAKLAHAVRAYLGTVRRERALNAPALCADARAWKASGFRDLPVKARHFVARFNAVAARPQEVPPRLLVPYEGPREKRLATRIGRLEANLAAAGFTALQAAGEIGNALS
jgi:hypothetical protein